MDIYQYTNLQIFGYIGTALVIISMMMKSIDKLRMFNIAGSTISMIYSIVMNTWPIAIMNGVLVIINLYHLISARLKKKTNETD